MIKCETFWKTNHNFGKWQLEDKGRILTYDHNPPLAIGFWQKQKRKCKRCGFIELDYKEKY